MKTNQIFASFAAALFLSACGGGGSIPALVIPPKVTPGDLQLTVPAPPFAVGSDQLAAFNYINDLRASLGLGLLAYSETLAKASQNHANYVVTNSSGGDYHVEIATNPGFTGVNPGDRARFAGYATNYANENGVSSNHFLGGMQRLMETIYHRDTFINQSYRDIGFSAQSIPCASCNGALIVNVNLASMKPQRNASDFVLMYPRDGQTNVNLSMGSETPNPFPEIKIPNFPEPLTPENNPFNLIGFPITFAVEASQVLTITSFTTYEDGQAMSLPAWLHTAATDPNHHVQPNTAYLTAKGKLKPNTTYKVSFIGSANGKDVSRTWRFTTASQQTYPVND